MRNPPWEANRDEGAEEVRLSSDAEAVSLTQDFIVVLDTNALFTEAPFLAGKELRDLIAECALHKEVSVLWHLPEVVRDERCFQMGKKARALFSGAKDFSMLCGAQLLTTKDDIDAHVLKVVNDEAKALGLHIAGFDPSKVDWAEMRNSACFRLPPFEDVDVNEKGFRDALILETFAGLVEASTGTTILALITNDKVLQTAALTQFAARDTVRVYQRLLEFRGVIVTYVENVPEDVARKMQDKAHKAFYGSSDSKDSKLFWHVLNVEPQVDKALRSDVDGRGLVVESLEKYELSAPVLIAKERTRWQWRSRIERVSICYQAPHAYGLYSGSEYLDPTTREDQSHHVATPVTYFNQYAPIPGHYFLKSADPSPFLYTQPFFRYRLKQEVDVVWAVDIDAQASLSDPQLLRVELVSSSDSIAEAASGGSGE